MEKYIPVEKRSKKEKQALAKARRGTWGTLNPVTRKPANPKAYNRKKSRREEDFFDGGICFYLLPPHARNCPVDTCIKALTVGLYISLFLL